VTVTSKFHVKKNLVSPDERFSAIYRVDCRSELLIAGSSPRFPFV
jgi:hypothetical protein